MTPPPLSVKSLALVLGGLLLLTLASTLLGFVHLGEFNITIAVAIAILQAALLAGFFMHALYDSRIIMIIIVAGVVWLGIMMTLTLGDYMTRGWLPFPGK